MVSQVLFCLGMDQSQGYSGVAYLHSVKVGQRGKSVLRIVASDGYRLSYCESDSLGLELSGVCLTKKASLELLHLADSGDSSFEIGLSKSRELLIAKIRPLNVIFIFYFHRFSIHRMKKSCLKIFNSKFNLKGNFAKSLKKSSSCNR